MTRMPHPWVFAAAACLLLLGAGCDRAAGRGGTGTVGGSGSTDATAGVPAAKNASLPTGNHCTVSTGADEEPRNFDAAVLIQGNGTQAGRSVVLTICAVPNQAGRATATISVDGDRRVVAAQTTTQWPAATARVRLVSDVSIDVPASARATVKVTINLFNVAGEPAGKSVGSVYLLGGQDAVFSSRRSLRDADRSALLHERDSGRISDAEYRRRLADTGPLATLSPAG